MPVLMPIILSMQEYDLLKVEFEMLNKTAQSRLIEFLKVREELYGSQHANRETANPNPESVNPP
jgi:hypothetical protein